jgi:hypothetical protein
MKEEGSPHFCSTWEVSGNVRIVHMGIALEEGKPDSRTPIPVEIQPHPNRQKTQNAEEAMAGVWCSSQMKASTAKGWGLAWDSHG